MSKKSPGIFSALPFTLIMCGLIALVLTNGETIESWYRAKVKKQKRLAKERRNQQLYEQCLKSCYPNDYKPGLENCLSRQLSACEEVARSHKDQDTIKYFKILKRGCELGSRWSCSEYAFSNRKLNHKTKIQYLKKGCHEFKGGEVKACVALIPHLRDVAPKKASQYAKWACKSGYSKLCSR